MTRLLIVLLWVVGLTPACAQEFSTTNKKAIKLYQEARILFEKRNFNGGIETLQKAIKKDEGFAEAYLLLGNAYKTLAKPDEAARYYQTYVELKPDSREAAAVSLSAGLQRMQKGQYGQAKQYFEVILENKHAETATKDKARLQLRNCEFAQQAIKAPLPVRIQALNRNVNAGPRQYFPVLTADQEQLIFTARVGRGTSVHENMYVARRRPEGDWAVPRPISPNINTPDNEGTCTISADGRTLVFTKCDNRKGGTKCDLYISYRSGEEWSAPEPIGPPINTRDWESQPALSADGRTLYFTSDRPGGQGGADLWKSRRQPDRSWEAPVNLGPEINTPGEEFGPFIHANGRTLFFSSNGHVGMGGLDLFKATLGDGGWSAPQNLGYPLNSYFDEISFFVTADGRYAYFSKEDLRDRFNPTSQLFFCELPPDIAPQLATDYVKGRVYDATTEQPLGAALELFDADSEEMIQVVRSDSVTGEYLVTLPEGSRYVMYAETPGYLFEGFPFDLAPQESADTTRATGVTLDIPLQPAQRGTKTTLNNLFFASGDYRLLDESKVELSRVARFLRDNPDLRVEISGHTDDVGSDAANQQLSEQRAREVERFLTEELGVDGNRLRARGYGEGQPVVSNDSDANRQRNRRIEFQIL